MLPFRQYHLFQLFSIIEKDTGPIDLTLSRYFRLNHALGSKDRKKIAEILYDLIRWRGLFDHFIEGKKDWKNRFEVYQKIDFKKMKEDASIPTHIQVSFPKILLNYWVQAYGDEEAKRLALLSNERAPITIRVNAHKISRKKFLDRFGHEIEMEPCQYSPFGIRILKRISLFQLQAFKEGLFEMQDEASQLIANLVEVQPKEKVLDYCSGSGGKSLAIAPQMNNSGVLYLHDIRKNILLQARKRLKRAGIENAQIFASDDLKLQNLKNKMDWVLVDAPCSGSGTYRRNPDLKWKFSKSMLEDLVELQRAIFKEALTYLKPNGKIVYATCSLFREENEDQLNYFLKEHPLKLEKKEMNTSTHFDQMDGFFGAQLSFK